MHDKKTYLVKILQQFVLTKLLWKKDQRVFALFEDHLSEIYHCKKIHNVLLKEAFPP